MAATDFVYIEFTCSKLLGEVHSFAYLTLLFSIYSTICCLVIPYLAYGEYVAFLKCIDGMKKKIIYVDGNS